MGATLSSSSPPPPPPPPPHLVPTAGSLATGVRHYADTESFPARGPTESQCSIFQDNHSTSNTETVNSAYSDSADYDWEPNEPAPELMSRFQEGVEELENPAPGAPVSQHNTFRGTDLCAAYDLQSDSHTIFCETDTHGAMEVFSMMGSNELSVWSVNSRFRIPLEGPPTFVRSVCMIKMRQSCAGSLIAYRQKRGKRGWRLAVIEATRYHQLNGPEHCVELWEAVGSIGEDGIPLLLHCQDWESARNHLELKKFAISDIVLYFVNQVSHFFCPHCLSVQQDL